MSTHIKKAVCVCSQQLQGHQGEGCSVLISTFVEKRKMQVLHDWQLLGHIFYSDQNPIIRIEYMV